jgi:dTDP-D-glucose 4,6-dehydratase
MKYCSYCNGDSPIDAVYCINCGALFQANTGQTYKLASAQEKTTVAYIQDLIRKAHKLNNNPAQYITAYITNPIDKTSNEDAYYITRAEFSRYIAWDNIQTINITTDGKYLYYKGKKIIFID